MLSTLNHFREEYDIHIRDKKCPAGVCKDLITYTITDRCIGCTICAQKCPAGAIPLIPYQQHKIHQDSCIKCGTCRQVCPSVAVEVG